MIRLLFRVSIIVLFTLGAASCAPAAQGAVFTPLAPVEATGFRLVLYRNKTATGFAHWPSIYIDSVDRGELHPAGYLPFDLTPGPHTIKLKGKGKLFPWPGTQEFVVTGSKGSTEHISIVMVNTVETVHPGYETITLLEPFDCPVKNVDHCVFVQDPVWPVKVYRVTQSTALRELATLRLSRK